MLRSAINNKSKKNENRIVIGKAGAPQGIHGDIRVIPLTDFPERFEELDYVYADDERLDIISVKYHKQFVLLRFKQYDVRETVAALTGKLLMIDKKDAMPLDEGEYYTFDIIGLEVFDLENNSLGHITEVLKTGSNDVYVASKKGEAKQLMIPALKAVVKEINIAEGKMVVDMPEEV